MQYNDNLVRDFAQRTKANLRFIQRAAKEKKGQDSESIVYEVTQLINSMLGLLAFERNCFHDSIPNTRHWRS